EIACDLPSFAEPGDNVEVLRDALAGACHEGAQHLVIDLARTPTFRAVGRYEGIASRPAFEAGDALVDLLQAEPRVAWARHLAVHEVAMDLEDGFTAAVEATEWTYSDSAADSGEVRLRLVDADLLVGTFSFPDAHLSGRFRATRCEGDHALFDFLRSEVVL